MQVRWENAISLRVVLAAAVMGVLAAIVFGWVWQPLGDVVGVLVFLGTYLLAVLNPYAAVLYCSSCRKRVKAGAETCHHCGQAVA